MLSLQKLLQLKVINDFIAKSDLLFSALILYVSSAKFDTTEHIFLPGASCLSELPLSQFLSYFSVCPFSVTILFSTQYRYHLTSVLGSTSLLCHCVLGLKMPCMVKPFVLVSEGCHIELPQTKWLKITEIYFLTVWKPVVQNQGMSRVGSFWRLCGRIHSMLLPSFWRLCQSLMFLGLQMSHSHLHLRLRMPFPLCPLCVSCISFSSLLYRHLTMNAGPTLSLGWSHFKTLKNE